MAMICKSGVKECTGCMGCHSESQDIICEICGKECDDMYFNKYSEIVGCDRCIIVKSVDDVN